MLAFMDLETTGLDPDKDVVLEVACVLLDDELNEVARFERVTTEAKHHTLANVNQVVLEMHVSNNLWNASLLAPEHPIYEGAAIEERNLTRIVTPGSAIRLVDLGLASFLREHCAQVGERKGPQLAGNTISFDRAFLRKHLPDAFRCLHYRNVDVTTLNETARRFFPAIHDRRPSGGSVTHRAMNDVLESIEVYKFYVRELTAALRIADVVVPTDNNGAVPAGNNGFVLEGTQPNANPTDAT